ncbi:MAG: DUF2812 domain-containing protein [Peptococcaceae bacterium]
MKTVYKILPVSLYDIPGLEHWLEEQANHGLSPTHLGSYAAFTQDGVPGTRYRLEPWGKVGTEPDPEQLELYRNAGWEYAFPIARAYFLFFATDPDAPELHSDLATRGQSLDRLAKQVEKNRVSRLLIPAITVLIILAALFWPAGRLDAQPDRWARLPLLLLYLTHPLPLIFLITVCFRIPLEFRDYRTLLNTQRALKNGLPPQPSPGPRKAIAVENIAQLFLIPALVLCLLMNFTATQSEPVSQFDLPYVSMLAMEDEPLSTYEELFGVSSRTSADENQASRQFSLLSPVWYEVSQSRCSPQAGTQTNSFSPDPEDGKYRYSPDLDMTRFSLLIPAMSRSVAKSRLDAYRLINLCWTYEEADYPGTDFVILAQEDGGVWQMAALGSGKHVAVFRYGGQEQLADHLDLLSNMVNP